MDIERIPDRVRAKECVEPDIDEVKAELGSRALYSPSQKKIFPSYFNANVLLNLILL